MPISDSEFNRARKGDPTEAAIKQFLAHNRDKAYSASEVADALGMPRGANVWEDFAALIEVQARLQHLAERGQALRKRVLGQWYYKAPR